MTCTFTNKEDIYKLSTTSKKFLSTIDKKHSENTLLISVELNGSSGIIGPNKNKMLPNHISLLKL